MHKFRRVLAVMRAYWPRGSKKVQPASVLPVSLKRGRRRFPRLATLMNPFSDSSICFVPADSKKIIIIVDSPNQCLN